MFIIDDLINQALYDWRKYENWEREDTAVQRRAKDLEAAGLSKTLAAGSAATTNVTSSPEFHGGSIDAMLGAAQATQAIKNAREENANLRKSRELMDSDIALKFGQMQKEFAQADYFTQAGANQSQDVQLKLQQEKLFAQQILESVERTKGYEHSAKNQSAQAELNFWKAVNEKLDSSIILQSGLRSSTGGVAPSIIKGIFQLKPLFISLYQLSATGRLPPKSSNALLKPWKIPLIIEGATPPVEERRPD